MSMISEQVKELRRIAKEWNPDIPINPVSVTLNQAADTIESLSEKLQAANMEQTAEDCGVWISCKDRLPTNALSHGSLSRNHTMSLDKSITRGKKHRNPYS